MLLMGTLMSGYVIAADLVTDAMNSLLEFMEAVVPIYTLSVGFAAGSSSAASFYSIITILIVIIQKLLCDIYLYGVQFY